MTIHIPFGDLRREYDALAAELEAAALRVMRSGWYVLGPEVQAFEQEFAAHCGSAHAIGVANGTDALYLALRALGVGPGDEVVTVANAATYEATAILHTGAQPVYVDIDPRTHTLDPALLEAVLTPRTRAILPVHLYGRMCAIDAICAIAERHGLPVVEDCAQSHGARLHGRMAGTFGTVGCFSFYPTKNLGALGDGGAIICNDDALAERLRRLHQYGWQRRYYAVDAGGINSRLDELQAALLRVKLRHLDAATTRRRAIARLYNELLAGLPLTLPDGGEDEAHVYHLYVVACAERDALQAGLRERGIGSMVHYPLPAHLQPAHADLGYRPGDLPVTERVANEVLSLPNYPTLSDDEVRQVALAVRDALAVHA
jgi:dTDP-3-amino-3,4,6-trideoxy-alpha-D-glucose transaminase